MKDKDYGIFQSLRKLKNISLEVGIFADSVNTVSKPTTYVADYAIANEFGTEKIPERSFMRSTVDEQESKWQGQLDKVADSIINGQNQNIDTEIYQIGQLVRKDIIEKIKSNIPPPNAPSTIRQKKKKKNKNKTLIDTGIMVNSVEARTRNV